MKKLVFTYLSIAFSFTSLGQSNDAALSIGSELSLLNKFVASSKVSSSFQIKSITKLNTRLSNHTCPTCDLNYHNKTIASLEGQVGFIRFNKQLRTKAKSDDWFKQMKALRDQLNKGSNE